jgi:hypothetical protein
MNTNRRRTAAVVFFLICLTVSVGAQEDSLSQPFTSWSKADAEKILNDSPWAKRQEVRIKYEGRSTSVAGGMNPAAGQGGLLRSEGNTAALGGARAPVDFVFTLRLRSGAPVRQALIRLKQLEANYDAMSAKDQAAFDVANKGLLDCPACAQNYVLTLSARSQEDPGADPVFTFFKGGRLADLKRYIYLADETGERRELVHFVPPKVPGDEAIFFFPRLDQNGKALFTTSSKELIFNLTDNDVNLVSNFKVDVTKLVRDGEVLF